LKQNKTEKKGNKNLREKDDVFFSSLFSFFLFCGIIVGFEWRTRRRTIPTTKKCECRKRKYEFISFLFSAMNSLSDWCSSICFMKPIQQERRIISDDNRSTCSAHSC